MKLVSKSLNPIRTKTKEKIKRKNKWTFWQFVFWGFNFIVGLSYLVGLNKTFVPTGNLMIVTILVGSAIAYFTGLGFAKISVYYHSNGGAFLYCKHAFKRKYAWIIGFFQYAQAPFVAVSGLFGILWAFQGLSLPSHNPSESADILARNWYVFVIDFLIFVVIQIVLYFGFTSTKILLWFLLAITIFMMVFSIVISLRFSGGFIHNVFNNGYRTPGNYQGGINGLKGFIVSITTFFFAFGGFEGVAVVADDVEDPKKNFGKALITIILFVAGFYIIWYYIFLGAVGTYNKQTNPLGLGNHNANGTALDYNPFIILFQKLGLAPIIFASLGTTIAWLMWVFSQVANKGAGRLMTGWVNARIIGTIAKDGLLPRRFGIKNKYDQFTNALVLDGIITFILVTSFYMVYRFTNYQLADALDLYTISAFIQYIGVILALLVLRKRAKILNVNRVEALLFCITLVVLVLLIIGYFAFGFQSFIKAIRDKSSSEITDNIGIIVTTGTFILLFIIAEVVYYIGKKFHWDSNIDDTDKHLKELEDEMPHDDLLSLQALDNF